MILLTIAGALTRSSPVLPQGQNHPEAAQTTQTASARPLADRPEGVNSAAKAGKDYVIGADDVLDVSVWKEQELTRAPQVTVILTQINSQRVYVIGEVTRPGAYTVLPGMTILQAISSAGGLTQFANGKKIFLMRDENHIQTKYPFSYKEVLDGRKAAENLMVKAGDTIVVP